MEERGFTNADSGFLLDWYLEVNLNCIRDLNCDIATASAEACLPESSLVDCSRGDSAS